jgi:ankyrin repeat protein
MDGMAQSSDSVAKDTNPSSGQQQLYDDHQDDDDSECWDDAKALLTNEDDENLLTVQTHQRGLDAIDGIAARSTSISASAFPIASSSSSAYSSAQSACDINLVSNNTVPSSQASSAATKDDLILHRAIFNNDQKRIWTILKDPSLVKDLVNKKDKHGNTALHLACMMGRSEEIVGALLNHKWSIETKNLQKWTPFHEACSYGNRHHTHGQAAKG